MKSTKTTYELTATKAVVREYQVFGSGRYGNRRLYENHLCVTGTDDQGQRFWIKFPAYVGVNRNGQPLVASGDTVRFTAKVKGKSDDGGITFLNFGKLVGVLDAPEAEPEKIAA